MTRKPFARMLSPWRASARSRCLAGRAAWPPAQILPQTPLSGRRRRPTGCWCTAAASSTSSAAVGTPVRATRRDLPEVAESFVTAFFLNGEEDLDGTSRRRLVSAALKDLEGRYGGGCVQAAGSGCVSHRPLECRWKRGLTQCCGATTSRSKGLQHAARVQSRRLTLTRTDVLTPNRHTRACPDERASSVRCWW